MLKILAILVLIYFFFRSLNTSFIETKIEFPYGAFLPDSYISEENLRMEIYYGGEYIDYEEVE